MKYIKLFEAFESNVISKTLNYIKNGKSNFLAMIDHISKEFDIPQSKITDEIFEYLPYKSALNYRVEKGKKGDQTDCKAKSIEVFGDKGIEDRECRAGKLAKKWGKGTRNVECPVCKGTGKVGTPDEKDKKLPQNVFKFWLDEGGNLITISKSKIDSPKEESEEQRLSYLSYHGDIRELEEKGMRNLFNQRLKDGVYPGKIYFSRNDYQRGIFDNGYLFAQSGGGRYFIHNNDGKSGSSPGVRNWRDYGNYSWSIGGDSYVTIFDYGGKTISSETEFYKNVGDRSFRTRNLTKESLNDAKFAIVLDVDKLKGLDLPKKSEIISGRKTQKSGALSFINPEDIKKQNIDRYISKLSEISSDKLDVSNFDTYFFRILGFKNVLFKMLQQGELSDILDNILNKYVKLIKAIEKAKKKRGGYVEPEAEIKNLADSLKSYFRREITNNSNNLKTIETVKAEADDKHKVLISHMEEISNVIYNKLKSFGKLETIDDAEILVAKIKTIEDLIRNKRYEWSNFRLGSIRHINYVGLTTKTPEEISRICNRMKNVIEKV